MNEELMLMLSEAIMLWYQPKIGFCSVTPFVVRKDNACGLYLVHQLDTGNFYEVTVHRIDRLRAWRII